MKQILIAFTLFTISTLCFSQTTTQLDSKYGFKHFVFNTPPSKYKEEIIKTSSWDPNSKITKYEYTGTTINDLFGVQVTSVSLTYYENKLADIQIYFGGINMEFEEDEYERVLYSLQKLYGKGNNLILSNQNFILYGGRKWVGRKVSMEVLRLYHKKNESIGGYVSISEKSLNEKRIRDEF